MSQPQPRNHPRDVTFDAHAATYDADLQQGLALSGETSRYFAERRVSWLAGQLSRLGQRPRRVLDFGCGTGTSVSLLDDLLGSTEIVGVDPSAASLECARRDHAGRAVEFVSSDEFQPSEDFDLAFCNGVFHHVPRQQRSAVVRHIWRSLRGGGFFAFWENNPWNPGTRWVMSRIPFDREAVTLSPPEARRMLRNGGFEVLRTDYLFIFPRLLRLFRWLETPLSRFPLGAQYQVLCQKLPSCPSRTAELM